MPSRTRLGRHDASDAVMKSACVTGRRCELVILAPGAG